MARRNELASEIDKLNQRLGDLQAEADVIDAWLDMWRHFASSSAAPPRDSDESTAHSAGVDAVSSDNPVDSEKLERTRTTGNPKKEIVAEEARKLIQEAGEPLSRADLYKRLCDRGIVIEGKDPEQVLSTMLWRTRNVVPIIRIPGGGYWLAGVPHEASDYHPTQTSDGADGQSEGTVDNEAEKADQESMPQEAVQHCMEEASDKYISTLSRDEKIELLNSIKTNSQVPEEIQTTMLEYYKDCAGEDYKRGSGFQRIFVDKLNANLVDENAEQYA